MESSSGLPSEILVLCTTTETKDHALRLLDWIRRYPDFNRELAWEPAMPAICSLIASEQLGNTVVTERRALQWSRTTPEHFRAIMGKFQKLLTASVMYYRPKEGYLNLRALVAEFCSDQNVLSRIMTVEKVFRETNGSERWHLESDLVQLSLFIWSCRQFKIQTFKPVEEIQQRRNLPTANVNELQNFLDDHCLSNFSKANTLDASCQELPRSAPVLYSSTSAETATQIEGTSPGERSVSLESMAREFGVSDDVMSGMRYLDKTVRESDEFKDLVDWSSVLGRCAVFYWTCSVLKIPAVKHITLRKQFHIRKKDFDKILSELDLQRRDLRRRLDAYFTENPPLHALPQTTPCTVIAPTPQYGSSAPNLVIEKLAPPDRLMLSLAKRGRPPKPKTPPIPILDPVSHQECGLTSLCTGPALRRGLLLLRSFNAKSHLAPEPDYIPPMALPPIVALVASRQLGDGKISERQALQGSGLTEEFFVVALARLRASIDVFESRRPFSSQTTFDSLALEHGLGIDTVVSMLHVRQALKESQCLSVGMDWESPLVKCSVFFWTCAILKVPDVKQTVLRSRSLVSKREFDSMLQLLNSHCSVIRQRLEIDFTNAFVFAPAPFMPHRSIALDEFHPEGGDGRWKRGNGNTTAHSEMESEGVDSQCYLYTLPRKQGRPTGYRKVKQREDGSGEIAPSPSPEPVPSPSVPGMGYTDLPTTQSSEDWEPPESPPNTTDRGCASSSVCPPSETGESKRRHTRYSTADYQDLVDNRIELWKPDGEDFKERQIQYRQWETKMAQHYGPQWENNISHEKPGIPFE